MIENDQKKNSHKLIVLYLKMLYNQRVYVFNSYHMINPLHFKQRPHGFKKGIFSLTQFNKHTRNLKYNLLFRVLNDLPAFRRQDESTNPATFAIRGSECRGL